jgi:cytochrome c oxidase assembly factor CtaG
LEIQVRTAPATPDQRNDAARTGSPGTASAGTGSPPTRLWLAVLGLVLVLASLLPPLDMLARHYVYAESIQFLVFAMAGPALIVLGAPWRFLRLAGEDGPAIRLAAARRQQRSFLRAATFLATFAGLCVAWRLPAVMDAVARQPVLVVLEAVTLLPAGIALWLEIVPSPPLAPRLPRPHRAAVAALAMWSIWAAAYVLGFSTHAVFHAYDAAGGALSAVADQELTAAMVWAVSGFCFVPVVILTMFSWLKDTEGPEEELQRVFRDERNRVAVKGWGAPARRRPTSSV